MVFIVAAAGRKHAVAVEIIRWKPSRIGEDYRFSI